MLKYGLKIFSVLNQIFFFYKKREKEDTSLTKKELLGSYRQLAQIFREQNALIQLQGELIEALNKNNRGVNRSTSVKPTLNKEI